MKHFFAHKLTSIFLFFSVSVFAAGLGWVSIDSTPKGFPGEQYQSEWKKIDSLDAIGFYKDANNLVSSVYLKAKEADNTPQVVKSLLYKLKYKNELEENASQSFLADIDREITESEGPLQSILYSIKGELVFGYYEKRQYEIRQRSKTNLKEEDFATWDESKFKEEWRRCYMLSVQNEDELKAVRIHLINDILVQKKDVQRQLRPTLYDFLVHRALDHFIHERNTLYYYEKTFAFNSPSYFLPSEDFIAFKPSKIDSASPSYNTFILFQKLIKFHLEERNIEPLIDIELQRLSYIEKQYTGDRETWHYRNALQELYNRYSEKPGSASIKFLLANEYYDQGISYTVHSADQHNKEYLKEADKLCSEIISDYKRTYVTENAEQLQKRIRHSNFRFLVGKVLDPGKENLALLSYKNIPSAHFRILSIPHDEYVKYKYKKQDSVFKHWLSQQTPVKEWKVEIPADEFFHEHDAEIAIPSLEKGHYVLLANYKNDFGKHSSTVYHPFFVSNLASLHRDFYGEGKFEAQIVTRDEGKPITDAIVEIYTGYEPKTKTIAKLSPNDLGFISFQYKGKISYKDVHYRIKSGDDFVDETISLRLNKYKQYERTNITTKFFTDRSIYRPGQTVYFKGIKIKSIGDQKDLMVGDSVKVVFKNANYQEVETLNLKTNDFGSFNGSFVIPTGMSTGSFSIQDQHGSVSFLVEEYKRPKFEVKIETPDSAYRVGDSIKVTGSALSLSGFAINGAKVKYSVSANDYDKGSYKDISVAEGITQTDGKGTFNITFPALANKSLKYDENMVFKYLIILFVTDDAGETRSADKIIHAAYKSMKMQASIPPLIAADDKTPWDISMTNLNGKPQKKPVQIKIERLKTGKAFREKLWTTSPDIFLMEEEEYTAKFPLDIYKDKQSFLDKTPGEVVLNETYTTSDTNGFYPKNMSTWKPGQYRIKISSLNQLGKIDEETYYTVIYKKSELASPVQEIFYSQPLKLYAEPGEYAEFYLASSKNLHVLFEVQQDKKIIKRDVITIKNQQRFVSLPILESYRGNITVSFSTVYAGRAYMVNYNVYVPYTNKQLELSLETFRDKLLPGSKEEWKIKVSPLVGEKTMAELLLTMYDASLDKFSANSWYWSIWSKYVQPITMQSEIEITGNGEKFTSDYYQSKYTLPTYDELNWFNINRYYLYYGLKKTRNTAHKKSRHRSDGWSGPMRYASASPAYDNGGGSYRVQTQTNATEISSGYGFSHDLNPDYNGNISDGIVEVTTKSSGKYEQIPEADGKGGEVAGRKGEDKNITTLIPFLELGNVQMTDERFTSVIPRKNFNETAFFIPDIKTDVQGNAVFSFTMPEAITKWKFMAFAHTKALQTGTMTKEVVTQKELMVNTFAPRFLREGDEIIFSAKVTNLTQKELTGKVILELRNPYNDKSVANEFALKNAELPIIIKPGQSSGLQWSMHVPEGMDLVTYTIKAVAGNFTDGEENVIPILSNRIQVTEAVPLWINGPGQKNFTVPAIRGKNPRLTLEFTSNPAWYAVQSLPYLMEYPHECAEQTFSRFYANSIAEHIANSDPKIKAIFEAWENEQGDALQSKLEQNPELKNILLEETPWVRDAISQTERNHRLAVLFDLKRMKKEKNSALNKLRAMQFGTGNFPWFKNGPGDRYITQHIATGLGKLDKMGIKDAGLMAHNAIRYLDVNIKYDYKRLIDDSVDLTQDQLQDIQIHYLYARSFFKHIPVSIGCEKALEYYALQAGTFWMNKSNYEQGMIALVMHRTGRTDLAKTIVESLKQRSIYDEELGMYWKGMMQPSYRWQEAPIETQALMIEAFHEINGDQESVDKMCRWLLKNKQTNDWKTTKATVEASYALLLQGAGSLSTEIDAQLSFGENGETPVTIPTSTQAGTGYFKTVYEKENITAQMSTVHISKTGNGTSWGAVYMQYMQKMDEVKKPDAVNPLSISKKLFKEVKSDQGVILEEITAATKLEVGDKIISRIVLASDRPMEYVHVKDMRAADLEPENVLSTYRYMENYDYYESTRDVATHYFISSLPRGTFVFEYASHITHRGTFTNGISQVQCMYAPEFVSHSNAISIQVK